MQTPWRKVLLLPVVSQWGSWRRQQETSQGYTFFAHTDRRSGMGVMYSLDPAGRITFVQVESHPENGPWVGWEQEVESVGPGEVRSEEAVPPADILSLAGAVLLSIRTDPLLGQAIFASGLSYSVSKGHAS